MHTPTNILSSYLGHWTSSSQFITALSTQRACGMKAHVYGGMHLGLGWGGKTTDFLLGLFPFWKPFRFHLMIFLSFHANMHAFPRSPPPPSHKYSYFFFKQSSSFFLKPIPKSSEGFTSFVIWLLSFAWVRLGVSVTAVSFSSLTLNVDCN